MRTTCDIQDSILNRIQALASENGCSMKEMINRVLRAGLERPLNQPSGPWECPTADLGEAGFDYTRAWEIIDAMEADAVTEKLRLRK